MSLNQGYTVYETFTMLEAMAPHMPLALQMAAPKHDHLCLGDADCKPVCRAKGLHGVQ